LEAIKLAIYFTRSFSWRESFTNYVVDNIFRYARKR